MIGRRRIKSNFPMKTRGTISSRIPRPSYSSKANASYDNFLFLLRTIGNRAVNELINSGLIQTKMKVSQPGDVYELEAELMSRQVLQVPEGKAQRQIEEEEETIQAKTVGSTRPTFGSSGENQINGLGRGQQLPESLRSSMEAGFGYDFGEVSVHTDEKAAETAQILNAKAYTIDRNIVFGPGRYAPQTAEGKQLLAHELAHTIQQDSPGADYSSVLDHDTIMRTPEQAEAGSQTETEGKPLSLLASEIPSPTLVRAEGGIFATVYFGQDLFLLDLPAFKVVEQLSEELRVMPNPTVIVDGYASTEGSEEYNRQLSEKRRQAVIANLGSKLINAVNFRGTAYGESEPAVKETGKGGAELEKQRAQNRRVVISIMPTPVVQAPKPLVLVPPVKPPTPEQELERIIKEPPPPPLEKRSLSEMAREKFDEAVDDILRKAGVPKEYRAPIKDGARSLVEKGIEKGLDAALDQTSLNDKEKKAVKEAIKAASQTKF